MLFCSGGATRIDVDLHQPPESGHAAKVAHVVKDCDAAMKDAAERGCRAALAWVERRNGAPAACAVSFDLPDVPAGRDVGDASGGLAFAVAAARAMHVGAPGTIAAAGEIESGLRGGPLRGVAGIPAKIEGALARLPEGARLVYPNCNDLQIPAQFRELLKERRIETRAVASVDDALDWLFPVDAIADPTAVNGTDVPGCAPLSSGPVSGNGGSDPPLTGPSAGTESGLRAKWLIAAGGAGAAAVAIWYGTEQFGNRAPPATPAADSGQAVETTTLPETRDDAAQSDLDAGAGSESDGGVQRPTPARELFKERLDDKGFYD